MALQGEPLAAPVDSLGAAVTLWAAVRPRTQELAASGSANKIVRLSSLVDKLAPHFQPLADAALESRDPDRWEIGGRGCHAKVGSNGMCVTGWQHCCQCK